MPLSLEQGILTLERTIREKLRHQDYDRVVSLAKKYTAYVTGENSSELLIQYTPREDGELFKQRDRVTQIITSDIANRLATPMYKVGRTTANIVMNWKSKEKVEEKKNVLLEALNSFYGGASVDEYLSTRMVELDCTDPNSFIVVEFSGEVNPDDPDTKAKPYPFEVSSFEAINYKYKNNELQFLIVLNEVGKLKRFTLYLENEAVIYQQIDREKLKEFIALNPKAELFYEDPENTEKCDVYYISLADHKAGRIPAVRVGSKRDLTTRGRTCVPLIHPARPYFEKSVKTVSEFDLTNCLHVFQQKIQYDEVCEGVHDGDNVIVCQGGKTLDGGVCKECKGTGWKTHTSSADIIRVKMPRDVKDMANLENFIAYKGPKMDLLEFQKKLALYELSELAIRAVYTSELFSSDSISTTATEKNIDLESVYDTLKPFADQYSKVWKHIVQTVASIRDVGSDIIVEHKFPKDFKMKSITALLDDFTKANTAGISSYVKREINREIVHKKFVDMPEEIMKIEVKEKYFPFVGKSEAEISNIVMNDLCSKYNKILYANFEQIFSELEEENNTDQVNFYKIESKKQRELVKAKVQQYIDAIEAESAAAAPALSDIEASAGDTQDFNPGDAVTHAGQPVEIIEGNPGPDGGTYKIKLADGTEKDVTGKELNTEKM